MSSLFSERNRRWRCQLCFPFQDVSTFPTHPPVPLFNQNAPTSLYVPATGFGCRARSVNKTEKSKYRLFLPLGPPIKSSKMKQVENRPTTFSLMKKARVKNMEKHPEGFFPRDKSSSLFHCVFISSSKAWVLRSIQMILYRWGFNLFFLWNKTDREPQPTRTVRLNELLSGEHPCGPTQDGETKARLLPPRPSLGWVSQPPPPKGALACLSQQSSLVFLFRFMTRGAVLARTV